MTVVAVEADAAPTFGNPEVLFDLNDYLGFSGYQISATGDRFLMVAPVAQVDAAQQVRQINVVLNWHQELLERVPLP